MERARMGYAGRSLARDEVEGGPLRLSDLIVTGSATLVVAYLAFAGAWAPGATASMVVFGVIALGPLVFRALASSFPNIRVFDVIASFWLLPSVAVGHSFMGPVVDALNPRLMDAQLAQLDVRIFGQHPSVWLEPRMGPWATELLMVAYYSYFLWPVILGAILYAKKMHRQFDEYILALTLYFSLNFALYATVPAIGPRFFLSDEFRAPLQGVYFTPLLDSMMRGTAFMRDCFPSGHTGATLLVMVFAYRYARGYFRVMAPAGCGVILATLVGRYHYGIDLLCALPLMLTAVSTATGIAHAPQVSTAVKKQVYALRSMLRT